MNAKLIFNRIFRRKQMKALSEEMQLNIDKQNDVVTIVAKHPAFMVLAKTMTDMFEEVEKQNGITKGANYITCDLVDREKVKGYKLIIQRWSRPSPDVVAANFRKALDAIVANPADASDIAIRALMAHNYEVEKGGEDDVDRHNE